MKPEYISSIYLYYICILLYLLIIIYYLCLALNFTFTAFYKLYIFVVVTTPQNNIIEDLESEVIRLKLELAQLEDRYLGMKKKFDELKVILRET